MEKRVAIFQSLRILTLFICCLGLSGFTNFTKAVNPPKEMPKGNPDPNVGIVVRYNSTAEEILALSSQKSRFSAVLAANGKDIAFMTTPIDLKPHKFTFEDEEYGFTMDEVYFVTISFDRSTHDWNSINFTPYFIPSAHKIEKELQSYIDQWMNFIKTTGLNEIYFKESKLLPKLSLTPLQRITYSVWEAEHKNVKVSLEIKRKRIDNTEKEEPKYNLRMYLIKSNK